MSKNTRLVYSTDPKENTKCSRCGDYVSECQCEKEDDITTIKYTAVLRIEKSGRGGKTVTVIDGLPRVDKFLKDLTSELKKKCGSGGTYFISEKNGIIEIQGDKRDVIRQFLGKKGIGYKG